MPSRSFRKTAPPQNVIFGFDKPGNLPNSLVHESAYFARFPVGIPTACTGPGSNVGAADHQHDNQSAHAHTIPEDSTHIHPFDQPSSANESSGMKDARHSPASPGPGSTLPHFHRVKSCPAPVTFSAAPGGSHQHDSVSVCPAFKKVRYIKRTTVNISMRKADLPQGTLLYFNSTTVPPTFTRDSSYDVKYLKGVDDACENPGTTGGSHTHTHNTQGAHDHVVSAGSHTHIANFTCSISSPGPATALASPPFPLIDNNPTGSPHASCPYPAPTDTSNSPNTGGHDHGSESNEYKNIETLVIRKNSISFRQKGVPAKSIALWLGALGCIPNCYVKSDGTGGTLSITDRMVTGSASVGATSGGQTHSSASVGDHTQPFSMGHLHGSVRSCLSVGDPPQANIFCDPGGNRGYHAHDSNPFPNINTPISLDAAGSHTHSAENHKPLSVETAFIERL